MSREIGRRSGLSGWSWILLLGALALSGAAVSRADAPARRPVGGGLDSLVILHTNDTHSRLLPYEEPDGTPAGGAAARALRIARERERSRNVLLVDAGDVFQGTPFFNHFRGVPEYRSMSRMGYDAGALGNHDLDDGPAAWLRVRGEARFPILSANVFAAAESTWARSLEPTPSSYRRGARWVGGGRVPDEAELRFLARPSWIDSSRAGLRVAFFGLMTPELTRIVEVTRNRGVAVGDPIDAAEALVPELRSRADLVVCLSHMGVDLDRKLAERVAGIDVIVGGHHHIRLERPVLVRNATPNGWGGTLILQAGYRGSHLGRLALCLEGRRPVRYAGELLAIRPADGEDPEVVELIQPYADSIRAAVDRPIFRSPAYVASSGLRQGETPLGNFVADVLRSASGADLAVINSGGIRAPLPEGEVTVGDVHTVLPFDNRIVVVSMPGWQVRQLLDLAARRIGRGGFLQVSGVSFVIRGSRASYIRVGGEPLDSNRTYRVATVDFLYGGGDGYTIFAKAPSVERTGILLREAAVDFLRTNPDYRFRKESRIRWEGSTKVLRDLQMR